jgi:alanine racemase
MLAYHSARSLNLTPHRDVWLEVNLGALEHNALLLRRHIASNTQLMGVVKSDAYGHGATMIVPILEACGFQHFGVASIDEALQLREAGVEAPLLVLGASPEWAMPLAAQHRIHLTVFNQRHIEALERLEHRPCVHMKVDTGMHRVGVPLETALAYYQQLCDKGLPCQGLFTHLAKGDDTQLTQQQTDRFTQLLEAIQAAHLPLPRHCHIANSAGHQYVQAHLVQSHPTGSPVNLYRFGIALFGYGTPSLQTPLQPVMGLKGRIVHLHWVEPGEGVSYNHTWQAPERRLIATLPLGYADGIPRGLSNQLHARHHHTRVPQVGNITMDQLMLDVTDALNPQLGDTVTLLDTGVEALKPDALTLSAWAKMLNTIEYELMCGLRVRLPRIYVR